MSMSMEATGNINWAFGDGGDVPDLVAECERLGYEPLLDDDAHFWNPQDDTNGDTIKTLTEMWQYIEDSRQSDLESMAEAEYRQD